MLLSTPLLMECEAVLCRPQHLARANAAVSEMIELLDAVAGVCIPVAFDFRWRPTGAHADDELVIETGINGHADAVATFNLKDIRRAGEIFGLRALRPGELLRMMRA